MDNIYHRISLTTDGEKLKNLPKNIILPPRCSADGGTVIAIAEGMFSNKTEIESIVIPESVTHIMSNAFSGCTSLKSIEIPSSVISMDANVFDGCTNLKSIKVPFAKNELPDGWDSSWLGDCEAKLINIPTYEITFGTINNGIVTTKKTEGIKAGEEVTLNVKADKGYTVNYVKYNGKTLADPYKFIMPAANVEITADFIVGEEDVPAVYYTGTNGQKYDAQSVTGKVHIFTGLEGITEPNTDSVEFVASSKIKSCLGSGNGTSYNPIDGVEWKDEDTKIVLNSTSTIWKTFYVKIELV